MNNSFSSKFTFERSLIYILIAAVLITFGFLFYLFFLRTKMSVKLEAPNGGEELEIGRTYPITWEARGISKVGIVLFKGQEPKWIAKDVKASLGKYEWEIYPGYEYGDDYWIAVFGYPWKKGNKIDYSNTAFAIVYPELSTCEMLSVENEWPFVPSDIPDIRRVFITEGGFTGNLGGLKGADEKCQKEAEERGFSGTWQAFIGGDEKEDSAIERLNSSPRQTKGIFIEAESSGELIRGDTCHRLLGKDFEEFLAKISDSLVINQEKMGDEFLENLGKIWLGRINEQSSQNCIPIASAFLDPYKALAEKYSFTSTCQNWTKGENFVEGYPVPLGGERPSFPNCYTPQGQFTNAVALGGLSSALVKENFTPSNGRLCSASQRLLCIEE